MEIFLRSGCEQISVRNLASCLKHLTWVAMLLLAPGVDRACAREQASSGFHPDRQRPIFERFGTRSARLLIQKKELRVLLQERGRTLAEISLPELMVQVNSVSFVVGSRVAVLGMVNGNVHMVAIIDFGERKLTDRFLCYEPVLSGNRRYLAFIQFFPPHFVEGASFIYRIYDFQKSPQANRPSWASLDDIVHAGSVVYPGENVDARERNTQVPESDIHTLNSGTLFWSPKSERLAFADKHQGEVSLVVVQVTEGEPTVRTWVRLLRKSEVCLSEKAECEFMVSAISFDHARVSVTLRPFDPSSEIRRSLEFSF